MWTNAIVIREANWWMEETFGRVQRKAWWNVALNNVVVWIVKK